MHKVLATLSTAMAIIAVSCSSNSSTTVASTYPNSPQASKSNPVRDWQQQLRGTVLIQTDSYSSGYGSFNTSYRKKEQLDLCSNGEFLLTSIYSDSVSGSSQEQYKGRWQIVNASQTEALITIQRKKVIITIHKSMPKGITIDKLAK